MRIITLKICLFDGDQSALLIKSIVVLYSSHRNLLLLVGNQIQMRIKDNTDARENIHTRRVLTLLNA